MRILTRSGIYQIINEINGKSYVGSSIDIDNRWKQHRHSFKKPMVNRSILWDAVRKYGIENFTFLILEECEPIKETLLAREQHYIDTLKPAYNLMPKAGSRLGSKQSPESIAKQMASNKHHCDARRGKTWAEICIYADPAEVLGKITDANQENGQIYRQGKTYEEIFGKERAAQVAKKIGENRTPPVGLVAWNKGVPWTDDQREKMAPLRASQMTDEIRKKISITKQGSEPWNRGMTMSEEHCRKLSQAHLGKKHRKV